MKKIVKLLLTVILLFSFSLVRAEVTLESKQAILYNLNDDTVLYDKNSSEKTYVASLTKIMTALVALENISNLDNTVVVKYSDLQGLDGYALAGFKVGDLVTYKDLLYGLMLPSGADSAMILANNIAGSLDEFVKLMNEKVKSLGLKNTHFSNPIGMDLDNYSTASDMAIILKEALKYDMFESLFSSDIYTTSNNLTLKKTTSKIALKYQLDIKNITGSKTGYTDLADYCLASTATIDNVSYLAITLNAKNMPIHLEDTLALYNYYSSHYSYKTILKKKQTLKTLKVKHSKIKEYKIYSTKKISKYLSNDIDVKDIEYKYTGVEELNRKIKKGDYLGKVEIVYNGEVLDIYKVYLEDDIKYYNYFYLLIPAGLIVIFFVIIKNMNVTIQTLTHKNE